jgi:hypothetical protein
MSIEQGNGPDAEYRFFVYDPQDGEFTYYKTAEARDQGAEAVINLFLDDGWDELVEQVVAGELTHLCVQVGRQDRPDAAELDAEGRDKEGQHWGDFKYVCNYALEALPPAPEAFSTVVTTAGAELVEQYQGIPGTAFQAFNAKACAGDL